MLDNIPLNLCNDRRCLLLLKGVSREHFSSGNFAASKLMKFTRTFHLNICRLNFGVNVVSILFCDIILSSGRAKASIAVKKKIKSVKACADTNTKDISLKM